MVISARQMAMFADSEISRFDRRVGEHLSGHVPELDLDELPATIAIGRESARRCGLSRERDVACYIAIGVCLKDPRFGESGSWPWARRILATSLPTAEKLLRLRNRALRTLSADERMVSR